ncbi:MAG: hypothetical protein Kow0049_15620 [Stanieria sp.]
MSTLIESLLYQSEGTALDFKKEQYSVQKATDEQKSELLKDILAFANSWRQNEAYIVIGVEEVVGGRRILVGTEDHFDDSRLQQFINGKTNRKVTFAYEVHRFEGKKFGVIRIPKQERLVIFLLQFKDSLVKLYLHINQLIFVMLMLNHLPSYFLTCP